MITTAGRFRDSTEHRQIVQIQDGRANGSDYEGTKHFQRQIKNQNEKIQKCSALWKP